MNNEQKLIPELRFPEFKNEGSWLAEELGQVSEIVRGGSPRPIQDYLTTSTDGLNWLKIADVSSDSKYIIGTKEKVIKEASSSTREVNPGDLILSNSMSFGRPYILKISTCIHDGWIAIRKISNVTFEDYLYYFISSELSQTYFNTNAAGAAVKNLNADIIKLLPIHFPRNKNEQQKIASCLSSLDEVIAAYSQKLEQLKDHKKGLMQNLFPKEGEKVSKCRFKEFEKEGEWVEEILGEICDVRDGTHDSPKYVSKGYPMITSKNLLINGLIDFDNVSYLSEDDYNQINKRSKVDIDDILFGMIGTIGNPLIVKSDGFAIKNVALIKSNGKLNQEFLLQQLKSNYILTQFEKVNAGGILKFIALGVIRNLTVIVPSPKEQQKIASCFSSLDALITAQAEKIEQLKLHKKGLMQGLFPKIQN